MGVGKCENVTGPIFGGLDDTGVSLSEFYEEEGGGGMDIGEPKLV